MTITGTRLLILAVAFALIVALVGIIMLAMQGHAIPDVLQNVAVGALTGLVGLLVPANGR